MLRQQQKRLSALLVARSGFPASPDTLIGQNSGSKLYSRGSSEFDQLGEDTITRRASSRILDTVKWRFQRESAQQITAQPLLLESVLPVQPRCSLQPEPAGSHLRPLGEKLPILLVHSLHLLQHDGTISKRQLETGLPQVLIQLGGSVHAQTSDSSGSNRDRYGIGLKYINFQPAGVMISGEATTRKNPGLIPGFYRLPLPGDQFSAAVFFAAGRAVLFAVAAALAEVVAAATPASASSAATFCAVLVTVSYALEAAAIADLIALSAVSEPAGAYFCRFSRMPAVLLPAAFISSSTSLVSSA